MTQPRTDAAPQPAPDAAALAALSRPGSDAAFDQALAQVLADLPAGDPPQVLSCRVLTRLAAADRPADRGLAGAMDHVLAHPAALGGLVASGLLAAGAAGYAALPLLAGESLPLAMLIETLGLTGGF